MAATGTISVLAQVLGLGKELEFAEKFNTTATPTRVLYHYMEQATLDTDEAIAVGDVGTIELIIMKCIANDVNIDTSFSASFSAEISIQEGEVAVFKPSGTVHMEAGSATEKSTIEYIVIGTA
jgi:hypothetical protein